MNLDKHIHSALQQNRLSQLYSYHNDSSDKMKESVTTRRHIHNLSSDNLFIAKLESKTLELQKRLDTQNYQIETLSAQTEHFMKICDEQKEQLNRLDIQMLKQQYEEEIKDLIEDKEKITELVYNLTEQYQQVENQCEGQLQALKQQNNQLTMQIDTALSQKEQILQNIALSDKHYLQNEQTLLMQEQRIDQLRNIQRKLFIALKQMQSLK